jgi:enoyl-CoA hydratase
MKSPVPAVELRLPMIRLEQSGRVLTAKVDAPPVNYMNTQLQKDFIRLVQAVAKDESVGAVVVTGAAPGRYITHFDIGDLLTIADAAPVLPRSVARALLNLARSVTGRRGERALAASPIGDLLAITQFHQMVMEVLRSPAVWIAAVNGPCGGGGLELSVFFDIRLASAQAASFQLPELSIGLTTTVGAARLTHLVGPAKAMEMLLEARAYSASEAQQAGLVNRVIADESLVEEAQALATRCAARPRSTFAAQKDIINRAYEVPVRTSLGWEGVAQITGMSTLTTRTALREWRRMQGADHASVFETDGKPWIEGTAVDMNSNAVTGREPL